MNKKEFIQFIKDNKTSFELCVGDSWMVSNLYDSIHNTEMNITLTEPSEEGYGINFYTILSEAFGSDELSLVYVVEVNDVLIGLLKRVGDTYGYDFEAFNREDTADAIKYIQSFIIEEERYPFYVIPDDEDLDVFKDSITNHYNVVGMIDGRLYKNYLSPRWAMGRTFPIRAYKTNELLWEKSECYYAEKGTKTLRSIKRMIEFISKEEYGPDYYQLEVEFEDGEISVIDARRIVFPII